MQEKYSSFHIDVLLYVFIFSLCCIFFRLYWQFHTEDEGLNFFLFNYKKCYNMRTVVYHIRLHIWSSFSFFLWFQFQPKNFLFILSVAIRTNDWLLALSAKFMAVFVVAVEAIPG